MSTEHCRNVIVGSGEGGKYLAWHLAQSVEQTMVIERRWIGGSCPNINCLPAKNEIWSAKVAELARHAREFGTLTGAVSIDMEGVRQRKREMVAALVAIHVYKYKSTGAELAMGQARFTGKKTLAVQLNDCGERTITADRIFLNLGTQAAIPPVKGLHEAAPMTHIEILELDCLPGHLIVIGGGYVGLEFAQAYRRFGSKVTILQRSAQLLPNEDADVAEELQRLLAAEGIDIVLSAQIPDVKGRSGEQVSLMVKTTEGESELAGSHILVATGRVPNTTGIGLDLAGVSVTKAGWLQVNDRLETTAPDVWAIGECAGSPQFTHASMDDFRIIRDNLADGSRSTHAFVYVYRPSGRARWSFRSRGETPGHSRSRSEIAGGLCSSYRNDQRDKRLYEGHACSRRRPHPGFHDDRGGGRRSHDRGADGHSGKGHVQVSARRGHCSSHHGRRPQRSLLNRETVELACSLSQLEGSCGRNCKRNVGI
jgi:pyruvate/2-oxoglutarate dehydrogenase complex dihydrolipoamide dehydrogenase (E3) component